MEFFGKAHLDEELHGGLDACLLMTRALGAAVFNNGGERLAKVVAECAQEYNEFVVIAKLGLANEVGCLVYHHERMDPHIAFRMPFGILWAIDERRQLRK